MAAVQFQNSVVQAKFDEYFELWAAEPGELRVIVTLMSMLGYFKRWAVFEHQLPFTETETTSEVQDVIRALVSPERRQGLREWYASIGIEEMNAEAAEGRRKLSRMIGEEL